MADHKPQKELNFRAVSEGLGFHPFSDGLPYAPVAKKASAEPRPYPGNPQPETPSPSYSQGAGATVAGPIRVAPEITRPAPRVQVPVVPQRPSFAQPPVPATLHAQINPSAEREAALEIPAARFGFIYLFKRMLAYGLDTLLNIGAVLAALSFALARSGVPAESLLGPDVLLLTLVFLAFFNWAVITAQEIAFGTSIGKRIFGLALEGGASAIFLRAFFFLPSLGFCGVGLLWALFNRDRRCWHDVAVDLQPIEIARL